MPNLKELKNRISSVRSTQKITSAMKMVAASKLRRAQEQAEAGRPYADRITRMLRALRQSFDLGEGAEAAPPLIRGHIKGGRLELWDDLDDDYGNMGGFDKFDPLPSLRSMKEEQKLSPYYVVSDEEELSEDGKPSGPREETHLFLVCTSDRGLCGGFNSSIIREVRRRIEMLHREDKGVLLMFAGRKGRDVLQREYPKFVIDSFEDLGRERTLYAEAQIITDRMIKLFDAKKFDICTVVFNQFKSVISQIPTAEQLIPMGLPEGEEDEPDSFVEDVTFGTEGAMGFEFEPDESRVLAELLPYALSVQVYHALLESAASEHGARMTAMDNATRNAGEMIDKLTLTYNRTRQAYITKELIEIISGAEAV